MERKITVKHFAVYKRFKPIFINSLLSNDKMFDVDWTSKYCWILLDVLHINYFSDRFFYDSALTQGKRIVIPRLLSLRGIPFYVSSAQGGWGISFCPDSVKGEFSGFQTSIPSRIRWVVRWSSPCSESTRNAILTHDTPLLMSICGMAFPLWWSIEKFWNNPVNSPCLRFSMAGTKWCMQPQNIDRQRTSPVKM